VLLGCREAREIAQEFGRGYVLLALRQLAQLFDCLFKHFAKQYGVAQKLE
jgi:hypothetical protein